MADKFVIAAIGMDQIGKIEGMWQRLIDSNAANSQYFADYYATFEFSVRCGFLREKIESGANVHNFVLIDSESGAHIGFATCNYNMAQMCGEIEMLYVDDSYRGNGLGKKLFAHALDCIKAQGIKDIKLCVTYGNEAAIKLYKTFGFYPFTVDCLYRE